MDGTKPKGGMTGEDAYAVVLHRKSRKKLPHFEADEELSLVPYLDVMMNLVIFMLVTIATLMPLGILNIFPPQIREAEAAERCGGEVELAHDPLPEDGRAPPSRGGDDGEERGFSRRSL